MSKKYPVKGNVKPPMNAEIAARMPKPPKGSGGCAISVRVEDSSDGYTIFVNERGYTIYDDDERTELVAAIKAMGITDVTYEEVY